jgi:hypothetical protein
MKLRIKGNSLRLRVTRSELERLVQIGRIEETIYFAPDEGSKLTYALEHAPEAADVTIRCSFPEISVVLPTRDAQEWDKSDQVGIYATVSLGARGPLDLIVEKDFACLDLSDADNLDTFPHPNTGALC